SAAGLRAHRDRVAVDLLDGARRGDVGAPGATERRQATRGRRGGRGAGRGGSVAPSPERAAGEGDAESETKDGRENDQDLKAVSHAGRAATRGRCAGAVARRGPCRRWMPALLSRLFVA